MKCSVDCIVITIHPIVERFIAPNTLYYRESKPSHKKDRAFWIGSTFFVLVILTSHETKLRQKWTKCIT